MTSGLLVAMVAVLTAGTPREPATASMSWEQALEQAARTGESVLVEVGAVWCHACNVLETRTLADSTVRRALADGWIVVEVDVDRRPDLHRLFHARGHDGLPTLHLLDPDGREVMRSGFVGPADLVGMLETARRRPGSMGLLPEEESTPGSTADSVPDMAALRAEASHRLLADEDTIHGGFGRGSKYIVAPETDLLVALGASGDAGARATLRRFVAAVTASRVHDVEEGGFHRYSEAPDWSEPHYEKLLTVQAVMLEALATDARVNPTASAEDLAVVRRTWRFVVSALRDPESDLFFASLGADVMDESSGGIVETGDAYYGRRNRFGMISDGYDETEGRPPTRRQRRSGPGPAADGVLLADANARLGSALFLCGEVFDDPAFTASARKLLDAIRTELARPTVGFLRYRAADGAAPAALEDVGEIGILYLTAGPPMRDAAVALGRQLLEEYVDADGRLRPPRPVNDGRPVADVPVADVGDDGARAIVFLARLARATGEQYFLRAAEQAFLGLRSASPPPSSAAVGLAAQALTRGN